MADAVKAECFAQIVELRTQRQISSVVNADIKSENGKWFARLVDMKIRQATNSARLAGRNYNLD